MRKKLSVFLLSSIMVLMLAACGSSNKAPALEETPNVKEEVSSTTGQIDNSSDDSSVESTPTPEATPTEEPTSTPTPEPSEEVTEAPTPEEPTEVPESEPTPTETPTPTPEPTPTETPTPTPEPTPTETPEPTPTETPTTTPTVPDNSSSSSNVVVVPPVEDDPTPTPTPNPTPTPSTPSGWDGGYDTLPSDGFDHIKVPTIDKFYDEGLSNKDGAFDFGNRKEWEDAWYDAYEDFLVANGSPVDNEGNVYGAFYAIHDGFVDGYQYLYYGFSQGATNGWGDITIYNSGMYPGWDASQGKYEDYKDAYFLEFNEFTYGAMDKGVENDYRAATTMLLSWIVPNPSQVEKAIYEFHTNESGSDILSRLVDTQGCGTWVQIGGVDVSVMFYDFDRETYVFAIRAHK